VRQADRRRYETLPINETDLFYLLVRNATVIPGTGVAPFTADIGIVANRGVRATDGKRETRLSARIEDLGDLHNMARSSPSTRRDFSSRPCGIRP